MFSCFCGRKKPSIESTSTKKQLEICASIQNPNVSHNTSKEADSESTIKLSKNDQKIISKANSKKESTGEEKSRSLIKQITSVKELSNQSGSILNGSFSSDSDTVPYQTRLKNSETSTAKLNKFSERKQNLDSHYQIKNFRTINDDPVQRICTIDKKSNLFHSGSKLNNQVCGLSIKAFPSVDYSKYSEIDMKIGSNEILDLDEEMQSKLMELQHTSVVEQRHKSTASLNRQNPSQKQTRFVPQTKKEKKKRRSPRFDDVKNEVDDLGVMEDEIQYNVIKSSQGLNSSSSNKKVELNKIVSSPLKDSSEVVKADLKRKQQNEMVEKTVKSELDVIIVDDQDQFFCTKESLKSPQSFETFRKLITSSEIPELHETLQEAENSFHCNSINEEFSRALITKHLNLAQSIFESNPLVKIVKR